MPEIFNKIDKIKPAYDLVYKAVMLICKLLLVADIVDVYKRQERTPSNAISRQ